MTIPARGVAIGFKPPLHPAPFPKPASRSQTSSGVLIFHDANGILKPLKNWCIVSRPMVFEGLFGFKNYQGKAFG
jgi:hypothetical protein